MRGLNHARAEELRRTPGATVVLFLTDRCPLRCAHCSVASRPDSPTIRDWPVFTEVVAGICDLEQVRAVAVTGGEPFAERRGLLHAVRRLHAAGKAVVLFTSGHWAGRRRTPWTDEVLRLTSTVYLSVDSFHAAVSKRSASAAVAAVEAAGCNLVLQVLDEPGAVDGARALSATAEVTVVPPLATGRGATLFPPPAPRPADSFGRCRLVGSPTLRYDGVVSACCNEAVITGAGPDGLRRRVTHRDEVAPALAALRDDPVLRLVGAYGPTALEPVAPGPFRGVCGSCWAAHDRVATDPRARALVTLLGGAT
jgi:hypothetical protein